MVDLAGLGLRLDSMILKVFLFQPKCFCDSIRLVLEMRMFLH